MTALLGTVLERDGSVYRVATEGGEIRAVLAGKATVDEALKAGQLAADREMRKGGYYK